MKEWYLMNSPNLTSGYESDALSEYAQSNFVDVLHTSFSDSVILYNFDLSESKKLQCIIQNNTADTQLKTMERQILCSIGTLKAGMYIFYHNNYWIVTGRPDNNKSYEKSTLSLCQYQLRWQNSSGEIIDRWCNITSSSKYGNGETGSNTIILTDDSLTVLLPNDDESLLLGDREESNQRRVFIDKQTIPKKVYKITREDDVLYDYGESGGILSFIAKKTELNTDRDNQELRICDYTTPTAPPAPPDPSENPDKTTVFLTINPTKNFLKIGGSYITFKGIITDSDGFVTDDDGTFSIVADFADRLYSKSSDNQIKIRVPDECTDLVGETIELVFTVGEVTTSKTIVIVE